MMPEASTTSIHSPAPASTSSRVWTRILVESSSREIFSISVMSWKMETAPMRAPSRKMGERFVITVRDPIDCGRPDSAAPVRRTLTRPELGTMDRRLFPSAFSFGTPRIRAEASLKTMMFASRSIASTPLESEFKMMARKSPFRSGTGPPPSQEMKVVFYQQEGEKPEFPGSRRWRTPMEERGAGEVKAFFEGRGLRKEIHSFEESTHNSELAAQTLNVKVGQIAKTILLIVDDTPVIVVISGDRRV